MRNPPALKSLQTNCTLIMGSCAVDQGINTNLYTCAIDRIYKLPYMEAKAAVDQAYQKPYSLPLTDNYKSTIYHSKSTRSKAAMLCQWPIDAV